MKAIDIGINECGENKYPCKIVIESDSVVVLCEGHEYKVSFMDEKKYLNDLYNGDDIDKKLENEARAWISTYLNREVEKK